MFFDEVKTYQRILIHVTHCVYERIGTPGVKVCNLVT